jgi:hypothetical protein
MEERCLMGSIETAYPAEGVSVKVISGVTHGVEVNYHIFSVKYIDKRDSFDRSGDAGTLISE